LLMSKRKGSIAEAMIQKGGGKKRWNGKGIRLSRR